MNLNIQVSDLVLLSLQGVHRSHKFQTDFLPTLPVDANSAASKSLSGPGYLHFLWNKRTYAITMWVYDEKILYLSFETDKVFYKFITFVVTTTFYNCFLFLGCKPTSFWFWFSDFLAHHFKTSSPSSYHHQRWLSSIHQQFNVINNQSNCCSFSYFTWNLLHILSKICSTTSSLSSEAVKVSLIKCEMELNPSQRLKIV